MNNNRNNDEFRFNKLYQLLGDDVDQIYDTKEENDIFTDNSITNNVDNINDNSENIPAFNDVFNIFNTTNNNDSDLYVQTINNNNTYVNNKNNDNNYAFSNLETNQIHNNIEESNDELVDSLNIDNNQDDIIEPNTIDIQTDPVSEKIEEDNFISSNQIDNNVEESNDKLTKSFNIDNSQDDIIEPNTIDIQTNLVSEKVEGNHNEDNYLKRNNVFRNKTIISKNVFNDGLDINDYNKKNLIDIFVNKKFLFIVLILVFICVCILTIKAFYFGKTVDIYNEYILETEKETDDNTKIYEDKEIDSSTLKKVAAEELINCISMPVNTNNLPDNVNNVIKEINSYYRSSNNYFAFAYRDIFTGFTVSYNENGNIFAASTIKAPVNIYLYEMASKGNINLDEELTYTSNYYNNGTGVLKNKTVNTNYSIRTLSQYAIRNSDNAAHNMLMDKYGRNNIRDFWHNLGTDVILTGGDNWGLINAHDALIYMKELYTFYINDNEYGEELMNNFINTKTKFITGKNNYVVANKSGWSGNSQHDVSIVFAENPYMVIALSNMGMNNNYMNHFNRVNDLAYQLHQEYWKYKMNECSNIKQYND